MKRNIKIVFWFQRAAARCKAAEKAFRTRRGADRVNFE